MSDLSLVVGLIVVFLAFVLVRTSGDGRSAMKRLRHPSQGGIQEEYGGDGEGHRFEDRAGRPLAGHTHVHDSGDGRARC